MFYIAHFMQRFIWIAFVEKYIFILDIQFAVKMYEMVNLGTKC